MTFNFVKKKKLFPHWKNRGRLIRQVPPAHVHSLHFRTDRYRRQTAPHIAGLLSVCLFTVKFPEFVQASGHSVWDVWDNAPGDLGAGPWMCIVLITSRIPTVPGPRPQCTGLSVITPGKPGDANVSLRRASAKT
jgi:hypothetical protein